MLAIKDLVRLRISAAGSALYGLSPAGGDRVIHGVFSGINQIMVQAHQNGALLPGGASLARPA
jgi:hypothetical protein